MILVTTVLGDGCFYSKKILTKLKTARLQYIQFICLNNLFPVERINSPVEYSRVKFYFLRQSRLPLFCSCK